MYLVFGDGKWCKNHQRILNELNIKHNVVDLPTGSVFNNLITKDIEGVFIVCSTVNHFPILLHCFSIGVPVFCEKPICLKKWHLDALKYAFENAEKRIFMSGHQLVFESSFHNLHSPTYFNSMRAGAIPRTEGAILSLAVHDIAVAQKIFKSSSFNVIKVEGDKHECKIILESIPGYFICEIYVSSFSKIRLRNISVVQDKGITTVLHPDNWTRIDLLKMEIEHFLLCAENKTEPAYNNFANTYIVMDTIFKIMDKLGE